MLNHPYNVDLYNATLKAEATKLSIIFVLLTIVFIVSLLFFINSIKKKQKRSLFIISLGIVAAYIFLGTSLCLQIANFHKDVKEEAYMQYEGPATVREERAYSAGSLSFSYIISFEQDEKLVELTMNNSDGHRLVGNIENIYIIYS